MANQIEALINYALLTVAHIYAIKILSLVPVQIYYEQQKTLYQESLKWSRGGHNATVGSNHERDEILKSMMDSYSIMEKYGVLFRDTGLSYAVSSGCFLIAFPLVYHGCNYYYRRELKQECGFSSFLEDYYREMRRLNRRVDKCIVKTQISIKIHMNILASDEKINGALNNNYDVIERASPRLISQVVFMVKHVTDENLINHPESVKDLVDAFYVRKEETQKAIDSLVVAIEHLNELRYSEKKLLVWPSNRNLSWQRCILKQWTQSTIMITLFYFIVGTSCEFMLHMEALDKIKANQFIDESRKRLNGLDLLDMTFLYIYIYITTYWLSEPAAFLYASFYDHRDYLNSITKDFHKLDAQLLLLNNSCFGNQLKNENSIREFDLKLLDLYVSFRIFASEIRTMFKRAEHDVVYLYCSLLIVIIAMVSVAVTNSTLVNLWTTAIGVQVAMNFCILPYAILNQKCQDISKIAYHIIGQAEEFNTCSKGGKISSHSLNLWRRLIADSKLYSENFSCELLGIASLNYCTVVRLNFYIISTIVVLVTHS